MTSRMTKLINALLIPGLFLAAGCNKWLDVRPKSEVKEEQLLSTSQGFKDALYGGYTLMGRPALYGGEMTMGFAAARSQDYDLSNPINFYYGDAQYNYTNTMTQNRVNNIWDSTYNALANINNLLDQIDGAKGEFTGNDYSLVKGEALGLRAYLHFDLLRLFAPSYLTGSSKTGIPYVTTLTKKVTPSSTVSQVVDLALNDLAEADSLLAKDPITGGATGGGYVNDDFLTRRNCHFNLYAAQALMARIYLYKGDKTNALKYALGVINSGQFPFVTEDAISATDNLRDRTFSTEHVFALYISDLYIFVLGHYQGGNTYTPLTNTQDNIDDIFEVTNGGSTDYRNLYLWYTSNGQQFPAKFLQLDGAPENVKYLMPLIRISEMYYIAAEATGNTPDGIGYLNAVRTHRGLNALPTTLDAGTFSNEILKEYRKEFYAEGQTFLNYKRLNLSSFPGTTVPGSDAVYNLPLPANEIEYGGR